MLTADYTCTNEKGKCKKFPHRLLFSLLFIFYCNFGYAQNCPPNIDFESGDFRGWTCYTGVTDAVGDQNVISLFPSQNPVKNRHTMYDASSHVTDYYGHFPVHSPNGSGHSVKLGNTAGGGQAEGISYEFTIPANQNSYLFTYYYAVVFQAPDHAENEQPRMETQITNLTDSVEVSCASFTFIAEGTSLPGFHVSDRDNVVEVLYKDWTAVSVDLSGNAGKRIRIFFKTADCTFKKHFGYAYIDVNSDCSSNFDGATFCPDDTAISIVAPYGYMEYAWYDNSLTTSIGSQQILTLEPPPVSGTTLAVKLKPYPGFGCPTILYNKIMDSLTVTANAGKDAISCNGDSIQVGTIPRYDFAYKWSPTQGLSNAGIANPFAAPAITTRYVVTTSSRGGGCRITDTVEIIASSVNNSLELIGKDAYCFGHGDSSILQIHPVEKIEWFKNGIPLSNITNQLTYRINETGIYSAILTNALGCTIATEKKLITIDYDKAAIRYPDKYAIINYPLQLTARQLGENVLWRPAVKVDEPESFNPVFRSNADQLYTIVITSSGGCVTTDTQFVKTIEHAEIYVPGAFTPNADGRNDYLQPVLRGIAAIRSFKIFNRRGQLMFEGKTELPGWDGTFKGEPQDPQAVVWIVECTGLDGNIYSKQGSSVLLR